MMGPCMRCGTPVEKDAAFQRAVAEFEAKNPECNHPPELHICLACFTEFAEWVGALTPEQKMAIIDRWMRPKRDVTIQ